ncbi:hypothetical protein AVEN_242866-1 [Araneus ventricosus]|uniref:Uncharacterized protein n=1 Tax=Araneus ventricosus TaxID=182803 RepID=A0A4Y2R8H7_ARAVE|nr:hypothetical protein AVEN_242866-1 [Araneus ventricosus]
MYSEVQSFLWIICKQLNGHWLFPASSAFKDHIACYLERDSDKNGLAVLDLEAELSFLAFDGSSVKSETFSGCVLKKGKSSPPLISKRDEIFMHKRDELLSRDTNSSLHHLECQRTLV